MTLAIDAQNLTKRYDTATALDHISFQVRQGEIMGFLGPNGAGKTTTLRILTGLLAPTSGAVRIHGLDVETQSLEIRRQIGYLPESVALYPELRVREYLSYRAQIKAVPRAQRRARVDETLERCALGDVQRMLIGRLSKGYRQRVALADTLISRPSLLILDEPTAGLDPHQIRQTRDLIKQLGETTTILLSTHILPEVDITCQRVTIINKGTIVAVDTPENLRRGQNARQVVHLELQGNPAEIGQALAQVPGVTRVQPRERQGEYTTYALEAQPGLDVREAVFRLAVERRWTLRQLTQVQTSLEDVFIHLTTQEQES